MIWYFGLCPQPGYHKRLYVVGGLMEGKYQLNYRYCNHKGRTMAAFVVNSSGGNSEHDAMRGKKVDSWLSFWLPRQRGDAHVPLTFFMLK